VVMQNICFKMRITIFTVNRLYVDCSYMTFFGHFDEILINTTMIVHDDADSNFKVTETLMI